MLKRVKNELKKWEEGELCEDNSNIETIYFIKLHYCNIYLPRTYPFNPPHANIRFITTGLDPMLWCFVILSSPSLKKCMPTWRISCTCCQSLTCSHNWSVACLLKHVAAEALFHKTYHDLLIKKINFPIIHIDVLEYMVDNCI